MDVLEYIHQCTYVHADLKGANILLGFGKDGESQAYLVDFGLASHYTTKDFKPDPKKMHNGTIEYTSRDAHNGVPTIRGDLEILAYNLLHWLGGTFPWEKFLDKPVKVQESKEEFFKDVQKSVKNAATSELPSAVVQLFKYVSDMSYNDEPDYKKLRKYFEIDLKRLGKSNTGKLEFGKNLNTSLKASPKKAKTSINKTIKPSPAVVKVKTEKPITPARKRVETIELNSSPDVSPIPKGKKITPVKRITKLVGTPKISPSTPQSEIVVNNNIKSLGKPKRTYELNVELDVSMDAKVIVNVNRKRKPSSKDTENNSDDKSPKNSAKKSRATPKVSVKTTTKVGSRSSDREKKKSI